MEQTNADETTQPRAISRRVVVERHVESGNALEVPVAGDRRRGVLSDGRRDERVTGPQRFAGGATVPVEFTGGDSCVECQVEHRQRSQESDGAVELLVTGAGGPAEHLERADTRGGVNLAGAGLDPLDSCLVMVGVGIEKVDDEGAIQTVHPDAPGGRR